MPWPVMAGVPTPGTSARHCGIVQQSDAHTYKKQEGFNVVTDQLTFHLINQHSNFLKEFPI